MHYWQLVKCIHARRPGRQRIEATIFWGAPSLSSSGKSSDWVDVDDGQQTLSGGPYKIKTFIWAASSSDPDVIDWIDKATHCAPSRKPKFVKPFKAWLDEQTLTKGSFVPRCGTGPTDFSCCIFQNTSGTIGTIYMQKRRKCGCKRKITKPPLERKCNPETCPHKDFNRMGSTRTTTQHWCRGCYTLLDRLPRSLAARAEEVSKQLLLSPVSVQEASRRIQRGHPMGASDAMTVIRLFEQQAAAIVATIEDGELITPSELHIILSDVVDAVQTSVTPPATSLISAARSASPAQRELLCTAPAFPDGDPNDPAIRPNDVNQNSVGFPAVGGDLNAFFAPDLDAQRTIGRSSRDGAIR